MLFTMGNTLFNERLRELRQSFGKNQEQTALDLGVSRATYSHWENGRVEPDLTRLIKIASHYNCSVDFLIGRTNIRNNEKDSYLMNWEDLNEKERSIYKKNLANIGFFRVEDIYDVEEFLANNANDNDYDSLMDIRGFMLQEGINNTPSFGAHKLSDWMDMSPMKAAEFKRDLYIQKLQSKVGS